jgi:nucleotide-binding universal stress UspA family protein
MIKDIIVNLSVGAERDVAADYALSVAGTLDAHVAGVSFAYEPVIPGTLFEEAVAEVIEAQRAESREAAAAAKAKFEEAARRAAVSAECRQLDATLVGAADLFGRMARRFDLSVVAQSEPDKTSSQDLIIEAGLFESGRPILVVPYIQTAPFALDHVMVCWDGSRAAARAIGDALPLLTRAKAIDVVVATGEKGKSEDIPGADIMHHLARHGLKVELRRIPLGDVDVANVILSQAADTDTDLIVMGGYGHSRWREFVLGGATRGILKSMTVPTFMSH